MLEKKVMEVKREREGAQWVVEAIILNRESWAQFKRNEECAMWISGQRPFRKRMQPMLAFRGRGMPVVLEEKQRHQR